MQKTFPPEFSALMAQYRDTSAGLGDDHPITRRLWLLVMATAPSWFVDEMSAMAKGMGLIPEPCACDDDGQKFYSVDALAEKLGLSADEVAQHMATLKADAAAMGLPDALQAKGARELHPLSAAGILNPDGWKPKGMHWRTFWRLKAEHERLKGGALGAWAKRLGTLDSIGS